MPKSCQGVAKEPLIILKQLAKTNALKAKDCLVNGELVEIFPLPDPSSLPPASSTDSTVPAKTSFLLDQQQPKLPQTLASTNMAQASTSTAPTKAPHTNPQHQQQMGNGNRVEATNVLAILPSQSKV